MIFDERKIKAQCAKTNQTDVYKRMDKRLHFLDSGKRMQQKKKTRKNADKSSGQENVKNRDFNFSHSSSKNTTETRLAVYSNIIEYRRYAQKSIEK